MNQRTFQEPAMFVALLAVLSTGGACVPANRYKRETSCLAYRDFTDKWEHVDVVKASTESDYVLRCTADAMSEDLVTLHVKRGEEIGFRRSSNGGMTAIAGNQQIALAGKWVRLRKGKEVEPDPNATPLLIYDYGWYRKWTDGERTTDLVLFIVLFPLLLGGGAGGAP